MPRFERPERLALAPALFFGLWLALAVIATWAQRLTYPANLEWMEGGVLAHAWRLQHFKQLYVEPGPDFIPMIYPPGYPTVLAILGAAPGLSHGIGRFVSASGTLAAAAALVWASRRHTGSVVWGVLSACIFLGMYPKSGTFYDLVRPDGLSLGLLTWALVLGAERDERSARSSGILLFLSFAVKHNAAIFGFPLAFALLLRAGWRVAAQFVMWAAGLGITFTILMQLWSGGLFTVWLLDVPASHPIVDDRVMPGTIREMGHALGPSLAVVAFWMMSLAGRLVPRLPTPAAVLIPITGGLAAMWVLYNMPPVDGIERPQFWEAMSAYGFCGVAIVFLGFFGVGSLLRRRFEPDALLITLVMLTAWFSTAMMRGHHGGFTNVFMPLHWATAGLFGLALWDLSRRAPPIPGAVLAGGLALAQTGLLWSRYDSARFLPDEADRAAHRRIVAQLENAKGPVLSPFDPWLVAQAGHEPGFHLIALWDIRHPEGPFREQAQTIFKAITRHYWGTIVDSDEGADLGFSKAYEKTKTFEPDRSAMMPKTGWRARPNVIWTPKPEKADE